MPWRLYREEPRWVAPLLMDLKNRLDQRVVEHSAAML
jgi:hypothetical protein